MTTQEIMDKYYEYANTGDWGAWCDLFAEDMLMDEQLAGHIEGLDTLRPMMAGMDKAYSKFQNTPRHIVVGGNEAAVVSHISAANAAGVPIEAEQAAIGAAGEKGALNRGGLMALSVFPDGSRQVCLCHDMDRPI